MVLLCVCYLTLTYEFECPRLSPHIFRHTFATKLLEKTKNLRDIKTVAAIMGDDYKVIIKTYLHPDEDNKYHCPSTILPPYEVILFVLKRFLTELSKKN